MNERIRELALQAEDYSYTEYAKKQTGYTREDFFKSKFAELIVRECVDQILSQWIKDNKGVDPANLSDGATYLAGAVCRVKEHFGVE